MKTFALFTTKRSRSIAIGLGIGLTVLSGLVVVSFLWFLHVVGRPSDMPPHADGIVAFTGGAERVETALRLLAAGGADKLLLSGIGGGAELGEFAHRAGVDPAPLASRVTLGRSATTTRGNAAETAAWVKANDIHSLVVVTAYYHMPRALIELERALPDVTLYPLAVVPSDRSGVTSGKLRLLADEYAKFLAAVVGMSGLVPSHESAMQRGRAG